MVKEGKAKKGSNKNRRRMNTGDNKASDRWSAGYRVGQSRNRR